MILFIKLLLAHLLGDFMLQPRTWVENKEKRKARAPQLYLHVLIHGGLVLLLFFDLTYWPVAVAITVTHYFIDLIKLSFQKKENKTTWFILDQLMHVAVIVAISLAWIYPDVSWLHQFDSIGIWAVVTALCFLVFGMSIIMSVLMNPWSEHIKEDGETTSLTNAGKYIGILERLLVFIFIMTDHWEGVGFLIAAKSVFRFGDLKESKDRKLTEYILIGTLISFGFAIVTALVTLFLLKTV